MFSDVFCVLLYVYPYTHPVVKYKRFLTMQTLFKWSVDGFVWRSQGSLWLWQNQGQLSAQPGFEFFVRRHPACHQRLRWRVVAGTAGYTPRGEWADRGHTKQEKVEFCQHAEPECNRNILLCVTGCVCYPLMVWTFLPFWPTGWRRKNVHG